MNDISPGILDRLDNFHLAGIIPISGTEVESIRLGLVHPALAPISSTLLAVERSVLECNLIGCETIWIVCNENYQPLLRQRIKDFTTSVYSIASSRFSKFGQTKLKQIPIFYVAIPLTLRRKRDSLGWSVLHGANHAFAVCAKVSKWIVPNKYYVSNPYGICDPSLPAENKGLLTSSENLFISYGGKTVSDGLNTSFSFRPADFLKIRKNVKAQCTGSTKKPYWSSRHFSIDKFFNYDNIDSVNNIETSHYYDLGSWNSYRNFISSDHGQIYENYNLQNLNKKLKERILHENE